MYEPAIWADDLASQRPSDGMAAWSGSGSPRIERGLGRLEQRGINDRWMATWASATAVPKIAGVHRIP